MPGLDTNVVIRFLVEDDEAQAELAWAAMREAQRRGEPVVLSLSVVLEVEWVLRSRYGLEKHAVVDVLVALLETEDVQIEHEGVLEHALSLYEESRADFADCLFVAEYAASRSGPMLTFDVRAARLPGARLVSQRH